MITIVAAIILGYAAFTSLGGSLGPTAPVPSCSHSSCLRSASWHRRSACSSSAARDKDKNAMAPINRGFWTAAVITTLGAALVAGLLPALHEGVLRGADRGDPVARGESDNRTLHLDRAKARARYRRSREDRTCDHDPCRNIDRSRVHCLGDPRNSYCRGGLRPARGPRPERPAEHRAHPLPGLLDRYRPSVDGRDGRVRGQLRAGIRQRGRYRRDVR